MLQLQRKKKIPVLVALNYIPEPIKHTKLVFSAIMFSFARGSGWDQLLYVITQLPASFR